MTMGPITIALVIIIILLGLLVLAISLLRSRPGLRRRRSDPTYMGPPRRCSDEITALKAELAEIVVTEDKPVKRKPRAKKSDTMETSSQTPKAKK